MTRLDLGRFGQRGAWMELCAGRLRGLLTNSVGGALLASLTFLVVNSCCFDPDYTELGALSPYSPKEILAAYEEATGKQATSDTDALKQLALAVTPPLVEVDPPLREGDRALWYRWTGGDGFEYALRLRAAGSARDLQLLAEFFPIWPGEKARSRSNRYSALSRVPFKLQLAPTTVSLQAEDIAARFIAGMEADLRGTAAEGKELSEGKDADTLLRMLGALLKRRLGQPDGEKGEVAFARFNGLVERTRWSRVLNGNNAWGFIQYFTVAGFWAIVLFGVAHLAIMDSERELLRDASFLSHGPSAVDRDLADAKILEIQRARDARFEQGFRAPSPVLEIAFAGYSALKASGGQYHAVPGFVDSVVQLAALRAEAESAFLRYLVWLLPTVGFVGTVVGIGDALLGAAGVLVGSTLDQQAAIQSIAGNLGTAFDTTFIALVLSVPAMLLLYVVQRGADSLIQEAATRTLKSLVDPTQVEEEEDEPAPVGPSAAAPPVPEGSTHSGAQGTLDQGNVPQPSIQPLILLGSIVGLFLAMLMIREIVVEVGSGTLRETVGRILEMIPWRREAGP